MRRTLLRSSACWRRDRDGVWNGMDRAQGMHGWRRGEGRGGEDGSLSRVIREVLLMPLRPTLATIPSMGGPFVSKRHSLKRFKTRLQWARLFPVLLPALLKRALVDDQISC